MGKQEKLQSLIDELANAVPELRGVLVASTDGLPVVQSLPPGVDANRTAAMAATALGLGKRITSTLDFGEMSETSVRGQNGQIFLYACGVTGVLALLAPDEANIGLIHLEARGTAASIANTLTPVLTAVSA